MERRRWGWTRRATVWSVLALPAVVSLSPSPGHAPARRLEALAPFEVWADGFGDLRGIAIDASGGTYVADYDHGTVIRIAGDGRRIAVATGLDRPVGLAVDRDGFLVVAEERAGRVVRVLPDGHRTTIAGSLARPGWLAIGDDGTVYVSTKTFAQGSEPEPADDEMESDAIVALGPAGGARVFADGFKHLQGLIVADGVVHAATGGQKHEPRSRDAIVVIPILSDGSAGLLAELGTAVRLKKPVGIARDALGALFATANDLDTARAHAKRVIAKLHPDGSVTRFAADLDDPRGLAFDADGNLYVADGRAGRVLRFGAPPVPALGPLAAFTNQSSIALGGSAEPGSRVSVFAEPALAPLVVDADGGGAFSASVPLLPNALNTLRIFATAHQGAGLTSPPAEAAIVQDSLAPTLNVLAPPSSAFVAGTVNVRADAGDGGSQVAALVLEGGGTRLAAVVSPALPATTASASASWDTRELADGTHGLIVRATDRAGNAATATRIVIVDNTPPETTITAGPSGSGDETSVTVVFAGTDNLTPAEALQFASRLDDGPWSPFGEATSVILNDLTDGDHRFEVKARDLAGNEDLTPATRAFSVRTSGLRVTIREPAHGASVPAGATLVRGVVESSEMDVGVIVNDVAALVHERSFVALVPVTEATSSLTAVATSASGDVASHTIGISVTRGPETPASLHVSPSSGVVPLTVRFSVFGADDASAIELDADGDGAVDFAGPRLDDQAFTFMQPGIYLASLRVIDAQGSRITTQAPIQVFDRAALDALLQARWSGMKDALRAGNVGGGVAFVAERMRADYETAFRILTPRLGDIDTILTQVELVEVRNAAAIYEMTRTDAGIVKSFEVRFAIDWDGVWRIEAF